MMNSRLVSSSLFLTLALSFNPLSAQTTATPNTVAPTNEAAAPAAPAPAATPAPAPAPAVETPAAPSTTERPTSYTMEPGDSLDSIAHKFDTSIKALAKLNNIPKSKYKKLRAGTVLQIPPANSASK